MVGTADSVFKKQNSNNNKKQNTKIQTNTPIIKACFKMPYKCLACATQKLFHERKETPAQSVPELICLLDPRRENIIHTF